MMNKKRTILVSVFFLLLLAACVPQAAPSPTAVPPTPARSTPTLAITITNMPSVTPLPPTPTATAQPVTLTILAASSLTEPFLELGKQFEAQHPRLKVEFSFGGSQQLVSQLVAGAPADVFASASSKTMDTAVKAGRVSAAAKVFASNRLVIIVPANNPARLKKPTDLARANLMLVLAAQGVPVGQYTQDFLDKASKDPAYGPLYKPSVFQNVVSYESDVKSVLTKVMLGEADAGIVYLSDVAGAAAGKVLQIAIPDTLNVTAVYPIAPLGDSAHPDLAQAFVDLVLSPAGQAVLQKYGFLPPVLP